MLIVSKAAQAAAAPAQTGADETSPAGPIDRFFAACGGGQPIRLTVRRTTGRMAEEFLFEKPCILIGRADGCDIRLPHSDVSSRHAYLQFIGGRVLFFDLESRTGTLRNGEPRLAGVFDPDDEIVIGPYTIRRTVSEFQEDQTLSFDDDPQGPLLPQLALEFLNARNLADSPLEWQMQRPVTLIGWSRQCAVQLQDDSVSRVHCSLVRTESGVWIVDLLGLAGTSVNGQPVQYARLKAGYELQIGKYRIKVSYVPSVLCVGKPQPS